MKTRYWQSVSQSVSVPRYVLNVIEDSTVDVVLV